MNLILNLSITDSDDKEYLKQLTQELCNSIASETEIQAEIPSGVVAQGAKGEPITVGVILLTFLAKGAAVALCKIFEAYINRVPSLIIEIKQPDGSTVKVTIKNITPEQLQALLTQLNNTAD